MNVKIKQKEGVALAYKNTKGCQNNRKGIEVLNNIKE